MWACARERRMHIKSRYGQQIITGRRRGPRHRDYRSLRNSPRSTALALRKPPRCFVKINAKMLVKIYILAAAAASNAASVADSSSGSTTKDEVCYRIESFPHPLGPVGVCDETNYCGNPGDRRGTCKEHGYAVSCIGCPYDEQYWVKKEGTCSLEKSQCTFRNATETCPLGYCPY